jgi:type II secretory pathway component PulJ
MISNDAELRQTMEQMERMYRALAALRREVYPVNPQQFALLAEGPQDELLRLQQQIDAYTGRSDLAELNTLA